MVQLLIRTYLLSGFIRTQITAESIVVCITIIISCIGVIRIIYVLSRKLIPTEGEKPLPLKFPLAFDSLNAGVVPLLFRYTRCVRGWVMTKGRVAWLAIRVVIGRVG